MPVWGGRPAMFAVEAVSASSLAWRAPRAGARAGGALGRGRGAAHVYFVHGCMSRAQLRSRVHNSYPA